MNIYQKINENYELLEITRNSEKLPDKTQKISFKIIILLLFAYKLEVLYLSMCLTHKF